MQVCEGFPRALPLAAWQGFRLRVLASLRSRSLNPRHEHERPPGARPAPLGRGCALIPLTPFRPLRPSRRLLATIGSHVSMTGPRGFAGNRPQGAERLRVGGSLLGRARPAKPGTPFRPQGRGGTSLPLMPPGEGLFACLAGLEPLPDTCPPDACPASLSENVYRRKSGR